MSGPFQPYADRLRDRLAETTILGAVTVDAADLRALIDATADYAAALVGAAHDAIERFAAADDDPEVWDGILGPPSLENVARATATTMLRTLYPGVDDDTLARMLP